MNAHIQEIMRESGLYIAYDNLAVTERELEFFAQQIVLACGPWLPDDALEEIKQHFGVVK